MIRVAALTSGPDVPSARFRVRQHIPVLRKWDVEVTDFAPAIDSYRGIGWTPERAVGRAALRGLYLGLAAGKVLSRLPGVLASRRADLTWLERSLLPGRLSLEALLGKPIALDVDDAIWLGGPDAEAAAKSNARRAAVVLAGNAFLAEWFSAYCDDVRIVPTAVDTARFAPADPVSRSGPFTIVWTGLSTNFPYLESIEPALRRFFDGRPAELLVIADRPPAFRDLDPARIRFQQWSPEVEAVALRRAHAGIMPLGWTDWDRGKCGFKMLQYMASGLPVVVTPAGMNGEILAMGEIGFGASEEDEWIAALEAIESDPDEARRLGANGRRVVETHFSTEVISARIRDVFRSLG